MYDVPMRPVALFNALSSLFGIHSQVIDFDGIVNGGDVASYRLKRQPNYWRISCIVCGIAFAVSFPVTAYRLLQDYHIWAAKSINLYINCLYYSTRYLVVVSIFFMQVRYSRESFARQSAAIQIFRQIFDMNRCMVNGVNANEEWKRLTMPLNVIDWWQLAKLIVAIVCYTFNNYLKLTFVFLRPSSMNAYDIFWFYYANIFIRLYASMFSISIFQQAKLFELLNRTIKAIKIAVDKLPAPIVDRRSKHCTNGGWQWQCRAHADGKFEKQIQLLMELHDQLRAINLKLNKLHSIQAISVVANGFINSVNQLYFTYCYTFHQPTAPTIVIVFKFIQATLHLIEVKIIFAACELLKNKMNEVGRILHEIYNKKFSVDLHRSMEIFSIKHLHYLSAEANVLLFKLNNGNFYALLMVGLSYLIILIQLKLYEKNGSDQQALTPYETI